MNKFNDIDEYFAVYVAEQIYENLDSPNIRDVEKVCKIAKNIDNADKVLEIISKGRQQV